MNSVYNSHDIGYIYFISIILILTHKYILTTLYYNNSILMPCIYTYMCVCVCACVYIVYYYF